MRSNILTVACLLGASIAAVPAIAAPARVVRVDVAQAKEPIDRFYDLSVGSDYPGTLIRDDSQAQLKLPPPNSASATCAFTPSFTTC